MAKHALTPAALRQALFERTNERGTDFYVLVTEAQAEDLASGYVPTSVKAMVRTMLDWQLEDQRVAEANMARSRRERTGRKRGAAQ